LSQDEDLLLPMVLRTYLYTTEELSDLIN